MKTIEEVSKMQANVKIAAGTKMSKDAVKKLVHAIVASGKFFSVDEVYNKLLPKKDGKPAVSRFRTKKILDSACGVTFTRYYDGKRFWYGKTLQTT